MKRFVIPLLIIIFALGMGSISAQDEPSGTPAEICEAATPAEDPETRDYETSEQVLEAGIDYRAVFCTSAGPIYIDLFEESTPITVNNFVFLAENGFYNNTTFHRVIEDFMAQGGDPTGTGTGGPGYQFEDEFPGYLLFDRPGLLAMANAGAGTNGSQFFITTAITSHLNGAHTIFGEVLEGQENVEGISLRDPETAAEPGTSLDTIVIIKDPANVESDYEVAEAATEDEIQEIIDNIPELSGVVLSESTGIYDTDSWIGTLPQDLQEEAETFLTAHNHEYSVHVAHDNTSCDLQTAPFGTIGYTIHAFASAQDAQDALEDEYFDMFITEGNDFESTDTEMASTPVYSWETTSCDQDAISAVLYSQLGSYITVAESVFPANSEFTADLWLTQIVKNRVYELILADVLRRELTQ